MKKVIKEFIKVIINQYQDVKIYNIAEFKNEWEVILQDKFDHKKRFEEEINDIVSRLKDVTYGVTQHKLEDDEDKIMLTFKVISCEEGKKDAIEFFKLMGFIEICDEYDLSAGPSETINEYNKAVIQTEELAQKYGLYNEKEACEDDWYHLYVLWPQMKKFFKKQL